MRTLCVIVLLGTFTVPLPAFSAELQEIREFIESRRDDLSGPGVIEQTANLDLNDDGFDETLVLYTYQATPSLGRHPQYLTLFVSDYTANNPSWPLIVGSRGDRKLDAVKVKDGRVYFSARFWVAGDPMCCPSAEGEVVFEFDGEAIREIEGHWRVPRDDER
jgi:hypothetical protein